MEHKKCCSPGGNYTNWFIASAVIFGCIAGYLNVPTVTVVATSISTLFINLLKLVSLPIIFLSIVSTASGMESLQEFKSLGKRVVKYTLLTTVMAATLALAIFIVVDPVRTELGSLETTLQQPAQMSYLSYVLNIVPSNFIQPFSENHVVGVLFLAIVLSLAIITLPEKNRIVLHTFFSSLYAAVMKITFFIVALMPLAIWAFITLFFKDLQSDIEFKSLALYLLCVLAANVLQAGVILPLNLKLKGISPLATFKGALPALSVAFFTKSSSAALPMAIRCSEDKLGISRRVASFSLPLCTTINMNACAAFILITVLFVSMSYGMTYTYAEMIVWIFIATIAAVGNAGVPMGCYFIASAFLAAMNVPLNILGVILPFYALIDMLESAINVWSDICVTAIVDKEVRVEVTGDGLLQAT